MIVVPSISSVDPTFRQTIAEGVSVPALNVRSADTVVITPDGQTIVIGGLMEDNKASSESKVPFLGDIPFLGNLFKDKKKSSGKSELVIFLTPHIVRGSTQLAAMTDREHQEMIPPQSFSEAVLDQFLNGLPKLKKKN
jgi:type II secretory pathway component GspD/PulD (secretin)